MPFVPVPKDLARVKTKVAFNLTQRQLICFGAGGLIGVPTYMLTRNSIGNEAAALLMIGLMLPFFLFGIYEKDGQPLEKVHFVNVEAGGLVGLPVFADPAPHLILDHLHPEFFELFPQLLNHIAHNPAVDLHVGAVVEYVEGTGHVNFQRRGKPLGLRLRLLAQERVEVP